MIIKILTTVASFVFVFGVLVFVHELGHFLAARLAGIRVERFYLGFDLFGLRLLRFRRGQTEYGVGLLPVGGYVKMAGFIDESLDTAATGAPDEFMSKNTWQKMYVLSAGVLMNLLFGFLVYTVLSFGARVPERRSAVDAEHLPAVVGEVIPGMPAAAEGMTRGAVILQVDGTPVKSWGELTRRIHSSAGRELTLTWRQGDSTITRTLVPRSSWSLQGWSLRPIGLIGIGPRVEEADIGPYRRVRPWEAVSLGFAQTSYAFRMTFASIKGIVTMQVSCAEVAGPLGIARISASSGQRVAEAVRQRQGVAQAAGQLFSLVALFSVTLALINILPVPALDGGHLAVVVIEGIRRKPLPVKLRVGIQWIGMVLIFVLFILLTYNDVTRKMP
ncbi:MAG: site-2 protease family protein [candidate division KSB1 bacterium]|nr:site-2 protease family protein [candidate division KSB1 bacterium]MDZ7294688.1 site-2 protease family protein [candidate division KSB1 bacterium]MDZ7392579.1 site-2 protease family protein [candidate division KSB1 bacterium]MDZ7413614.1 site-2 protease family protein [candidate division KSB1 bacterium]